MLCGCTKAREKEPLQRQEVEEEKTDDYSDRLKCGWKKYFHLFFYWFISVFEFIFCCRPMEGNVDSPSAQHIVSSPSPPSLLANAVAVAAVAAAAAYFFRRSNSFAANKQQNPITS